MWKRYVVIVAAIVGGSFRSARAENASSSYSLTPTAGGFGSSPVLGLKLGYDVAGRGMLDSIGVEGSYLVKWSGRGNANLFRIEVVVPATPRERLIPFLTVGPGSISGNGDTGFALSLAFGGGVKYFVSDTLALRGDLRETLVRGQKPSAGNVEYTVGLSWIFGKKEWSIEDLEKKNAAAGEGALPSGATSEGRNSGKTENSAKKPVAASTGKPGGEQTTPPGTREKGEKSAAAAVGREDGAAPAASSGAIQKAEHPEKGSAEPGQRANPEKPAAASGAGSDGKSWQQPTPEAGGARALLAKRGSYTASVQQPGAKKSQPAASKEPGSDLRQGRSLQEVTVAFALNKADLSPGYQRLLRNTADYMRVNSGTKAVISGHTDSMGQLRYNLELSRRRAENVKRYLVKLGIAPSRLVTKGYGPRTPIAGIALTSRKNRRATAVVTFVDSP